MTSDLPAGLVLADNIHDLSAHRYFLFQQAWARLVGVGSTMYDQDGHLARLRLFLNKDAQAAEREFQHLVLAFRNLTGADGAPVDYLAATLAPLVLRLDGQPCTDDSQAGLAAVAERVSRLLTRGQLEQAVEQSKKNFRPDSL